MKTLLVGINAKYIHPNLAIRLLKKNTTYPCDIKEFTIKDDINSILDYLNNYEIIAFSCYIWNIEIIKEILTKLKDKIIILGGPEVSYNAHYYIENNLANYVIKNEGEETFHLLLDHIENNTDITTIPNLYYKDGFTFDKLVDLSKTKMAYDLLDDLSNKIIYIETSRGCPYKCAYCMASLDNKLRFFDYEEIKNQLQILMNRGARVFKFLDRTFNANKRMFIGLIDFIIQNHKDNMSFQFEITGDLLDDDIINYINNKAPKNLFRFEIGIQSTNIQTNLSVDRIQNNEKLFYNIKKIQDANIIDLHLDLIAGLPYEDYDSFINTFNEVLCLRPKELQLGFLKLLYGTKLKNNADKYGYIYNNTAPYEIIANDFLSENDIKNIHLTEDAFERYYNSNIIPKSMKFILDNETNYYNFFYNLGLRKHKNGLDNTFLLIDEFLKDKSYYEEVHKLLILDYLNHFQVKPKAWWNERIEKKERNIILRKIVHNTNYLITDLYKYSLLVNLDNTLMLAIYMPNKKDIIILNKDKL